MSEDMNRDDIIEYMEEHDISLCEGCNQEVETKMCTKNGHEFFCPSCWKELKTMEREA